MSGKNTQARPPHAQAPAKLATLADLDRMLPPASADLFIAISDGKYDADLEGFIRVIRDRKSTLARRDLRSVEVGDDVTLSRTINPHYLRGLKVKVKKVNGASVVVDIANDPAYGRFSGARNVRVPAVCIER